VAVAVAVKVVAKAVAAATAAVTDNALGLLQPTYKPSPALQGFVVLGVCAMFVGP
jgi:hypothetical protein